MPITIEELNTLSQEEKEKYQSMTLAGFKFGSLEQFRTITAITVKSTPTESKVINEQGQASESEDDTDDTDIEFGAPEEDFKAKALVAGIWPVVVSKNPILHWIEMQSVKIPFLQFHLEFIGNNDKDFPNLGRATVYRLPLRVVPNPITTFKDRQKDCLGYIKDAFDALQLESGKEYTRLGDKITLKADLVIAHEAMAIVTWDKFFSRNIIKALQLMPKEQI